MALQRQHTAKVSTKKQDVAAESNHSLTSFSQGIFYEDEDKWQPKIFSLREVLGDKIVLEDTCQSISL